MTNEELTVLIRADVDVPENMAALVCGQAAALPV